MNNKKAKSVSTVPQTSEIHYPARMDSDVKESSHQNGITAIGNLGFGTVHCSKEGRVRVSVARDVRRQKTEKISKMKHFTSSTSKLAINAKGMSACLFACMSVCTNSYIASAANPTNRNHILNLPRSKLSNFSSYC